MSEQQNWLDELDERSRQKQEAFLNNIASRLGRPRQTTPPLYPFKGAPDFWKQFTFDPEEKVSVFTRNFSAAGGHVICTDDMEGARRSIIELMDGMKVQRILRQDQPELEQLGLELALPDAEVLVWNRDEGENDGLGRGEGQGCRAVDWRAKAAGADIGIVLADYAVSYTGSIVVLSGETKGRSVSLLPAVLIAVIPVSSLVTRLGEVLENFGDMGRERLPAGIHFISGPSRSADIENDLTIGVHGPGVVYAILVEASPL